MHKWVGILSLGLVLVACQPTKPQRPTFQGTAKVDTTMVQLITMNQQMAQQADVQLAHIAPPDYVLIEDNFWVKGLYPQNEQVPILQQGDYIDLNVEFYSLTGELLFVHQITAKLGQVDEIQAVVRVLYLMQRGQHISLLVPWYLAFGSTGNQDVSAYQNIRVELSVQ